MSVSVSRPLCEARSNEVWQLTFHKIATRSAIRSTLKTSTTFCVKKASHARSSLFLSVGTERKYRITMKEECIIKC